MKRILSYILLVLLTCPLYATITIGGAECAADTTEYYQAGPSTWYTRFRVQINGTWRNCYLLDADLNNQYIQPEMHQGQNQFGKTEALVSAYQAMNVEQHRPIGGVNTNFFWTANAHPGYFEGLLGCTVGGTAHNGVMIGNPDDWNRYPSMDDSGVGYVVIDNLKRAYIDCMNYSGRIIIGTDTFPIWETNRYRNNPHADEIVLFNDYQGNRPTRETTGTEIVFSTENWNINGTMQCTVQSINHAGGTIIPQNQGVLQGLGAGKNFLDRLQAGDSFQVQLEVYPVTNPDFRPSIREMVSGNCFVMKDGVLLSRNYESEPTMGAYNTNTYPRTMIATNATNDKLYMLVVETPGLTTAQMCEILKHAGAAHAAGMDGGGSAQMCLLGSVVNRTTEANPRAVPASMWLITNAPDDSVVTRIAPTRSTVTLPVYGSYKPTFYCYNQYDVLLARNFKGTTLSCDPSVGYIDADGYFVCQGSGILHCAYMNATYDVQVNAVADAAFHFRLDSVLISDDTHYQVEVLAEAGGQTISINPVLLDWYSVQPPTPEGEIVLPCICGADVDENGVLIAGENGRSWVIGKLGGHADTLIVDVETPWQRPLLWSNMVYGASCTIVPSATAWSPIITTNADGKSELTFDYSTKRNPNISFEFFQKLYSVPEQVEIRFSTEDVALKEALVALRANNETDERTQRFTELQTGANSLLIDIPQLFNSTDIALYPIRLQYFTLYFNSMPAGQKSIVFDGIYLHYKTITLHSQFSTLNSLKVYPNPTEDYIVIEGSEVPNFTLYDLQGRIIQSTNQPILNVSTLSAGTYILQAGSESVQIIKK